MLAALQGADVTKGERLKRYHEVLAQLPGTIHTCMRCRQRGHDHGDVHLPGNSGMCWRCRQYPDALSWENGLDLDVTPPPDGADDDECHQYPGVPLAMQACDQYNRTTSVPAEARIAWHKLRVEFGELSPVEEALICRVTSVTAI